MDQFEQIIDVIDQNEIFILKNYNRLFKNHRKRLDILIIDGTERKQMLECLICTSENQLKFIPLIQILDSDDSAIIKGWPISGDQEIFNKFKEIPSKYSFKKQIITEIENFYNSLRKEINRLIDVKESKSLDNIEKMFDSLEYPINVYNRISKKQELKEIIINLQKDSEKQNEMFTQNIQEALQNQSTLKKQILDSIENMNNHKRNHTIKLNKTLLTQLIK